MANRTPEDPDIKDRKGTQPAKYHSGLSKSTKAKRDAHFKKGQKMDDNNPAAYKPAPGDASAKTKESKYTKKFKDMYGEEKMKEEIFEDTSEALKNKAEKSGVSVGILRKVYNRGVAAWRTGHRPGTTPEQWGMARVNSFLTGGKTRTTADADLWKKVRKEEYDATPGEVQESITRRTVSYGQGPKKTLGQIEIPPPNPSSSRPKKKKHKSAAAVAKIQKALDREKKNDKPGMLRRSDDYMKKSYKSGKSSAYFAKRYTGEEMKESMDPRDVTDDPGFVVTYQDKREKENIKRFFPTIASAKKYAEKANKINRVGGKAKIYKTDGRKLMPMKEWAEIDEAVEFHVRMDHLDGDKRMKGAVDLLKKYEKSKKISFEGETDKGVIFSAKSKSDISRLDRELKKFATGAQMNEAVDPSDTGGAEEVSMAKKQIAAMRHYLDGIESSVEAKGDMEEWYQNKLTKANDYLKTLYGYAKGDVAEEVDLDEATFKVDVEGLPTFYMDAPSQGKVNQALRKLLRKASSIDDVSRTTTTKIRQDFRDRVKNPTSDSDEDPSDE